MLENSGGVESEEVMCGRHALEGISCTALSFPALLFLLHDHHEARQPFYHYGLRIMEPSEHGLKPLRWKLKLSSVSLSGVLLQWEKADQLSQ